MANVDPTYNVTCKPGTVVITLNSTRNSPGVMFECKADYQTRMRQIYELERDGVEKELPHLSLSTKIMAFLARWHDPMNKAERLQSKIERSFEKAAASLKSGDKYAAQAKMAKSSSERKKLEKKARDAYEDVEDYLEQVEDFRDDFAVLVKQLGKDAPSGMKITLVKANSRS